MSMESEWKIVTKQDKRRVMKSGRNSRRSSHQLKANKKYIVAHIEGVSDAEHALKMISDCIDFICSTDFYKSFKESWISHDEWKHVTQIVCYGIGNFLTGANSAPMWQLALSICIRKSITANQTAAEKESISIVYYDPCVTPLETKVLSELNIELLATNEQGKRSVRNLPTLFFMPHCPLRLYENVFWANWDVLTSVPIIVFGNSLHTYADLSKVGGRHLDIIAPIMTWLQEQIVSFTKEDLQNMPGNFESAFNDCYLTYVSEVIDGVEKLSWPDRTKDIPSDDDEVIH